MEDSVVSVLCSTSPIFFPKGNLKGDPGTSGASANCGRSLLNLTEGGPGSGSGEPLRSKLGCLPFTKFPSKEDWVEE